MGAQVSEVQAFKAIDGTVHETYVKAHHRNIWVLAHRMFAGFGDADNDEEGEGNMCAKRLYAKLTDTTQSRNLVSKTAIADLAKELE